MGAGVGGALRYIAWKHNCSVEGIELNKEFCETNKQINELFSEEEFYNFINVYCFNIFDASEEFNSKYDAGIIQLVVLHCSQKEAFLSKFASTLKQGAAFMIEEFGQYQPFTDQDESQIATSQVHIPPEKLPDQAE